MSTRIMWSVRRLMGGNNTAYDCNVPCKTFRPTILILNWNKQVEHIQWTDPILATITWGLHK